VLLFLYFGFLSLHASIEDVRKADRSAALLAIVGVINVPIIYFSVKWWNTLHQGASVSLTKAPTMATQMLTGMLIMVFAFWMYSIAVALYRCRNLILHMGGYALFVWGSYLVTILVLVIEIALLRSRNKTLRKTLISEIRESQRN
jgi:heme exporter protein C